MTALAMKGDRERCLEAGMDDYLSKPVQPAELAAALERWLAREADDSLPDSPGEVAEEQPAAAPDAPHPTTPVFDQAAMLHRLMDDEDLAREIVKAFLEDIPVQIEKMASAVAAGDCRQAEQQAHKIRGASANVSGEALREVAFEMEKAGRAGDIATLVARMAELEDQFDRLREAMQGLDS